MKLVRMARAALALSVFAMPLAATAEEFSYASQAAIVEACAEKAELPKCMCYLSNLQKKMTVNEMAGLDLALRTGQPADKKAMEKLSAAQLECFK